MKNLHIILFIFSLLIAQTYPQQFVSGKKYHSSANNVLLNKKLLNTKGMLNDVHLNKKKIFKTNSKFYQPSQFTYYTLPVLKKKPSGGDTNRTTYTYDSKGNVLTEIQDYQKNNIWVNGKKYSSTYDDKGNLLTYLTEQWDDTVWIKVAIETHTYDNNCNMISDLYQICLNGTWLNNSRSTSVYDSAGKMTNILGEVWNSGTWENSYQYFYTYGKYSYDFLMQNWSNGAWINNTKGTYTYDSSFNNISILYTYWSNEMWGSQEKWDYTYDSAGNNLSEIYYSFYNNDWELDGRNTYTYNEKGKMITSLSESSYDGIIIPDSRETDSYDNDSNLLTQLEEHYTDSVWVNFDKTVYTYDGNGNAILGEDFQWTGDNWSYNNGSIILPYNYGNNSLDNLYAYKVEASYVLINDVKNNPPVVSSYNLSQNYPNPFNPSTTIKYSIPNSSIVSLKVYDILGNEVKTLVNEFKQSGSYAINFNASGLSSGVYIYKISAGDFISARKMILLK